MLHFHPETSDSDSHRPADGDVRKLLITGLSGFVGRNLHGYLSGDSNALWDIVVVPRFDLRDPGAIRSALVGETPDAVIHLAGQPFVPESFRDPVGTLQTNLIGTQHLLSVLKELGFHGSFLYVSSGDVYGQVAEDQLPIREDLPAIPRNPYSVSKFAAEALCRQWSFMVPWRIMIARAFNHIGPGQSETFIVPSVARQLHRIRLGQQEPVIQVGDIDITRDFLDVRDVVNAYLSLLERGTNGETYNVCSGVERSVRDLIGLMMELSGIDARLVADPTRFRPAEQRRVCGSYAKLHKATGWSPEMDLRDTLQRVLDDWAHRIPPLGE